MCGICGWYNLKQNTKNNRHDNDIKPMLHAISHRGPDGENYFANEDIMLGFCRLSFIDLQGGMQPISNEDESIYITCNGEIFNYRELREELEGQGHSFKTNTDIEVIVHLYEQYELKFADHLNGQFAVVIYDKKRRKTILVRDQFGIAPLFYTKKNGCLIWGSEIKAILEYPGIERKLNPTAVDQVLNFPGIVAPTTFFKDIYALEAGHMLICDCTGEICNKEYWDLNYKPKSEDLGEEYYITHLRELLVDSIRIRLQADVPIGFYVSGGLDSSIVAAFINKYIAKEHSSFSAEVCSEDHNESKYQKMLKDAVKSDHHHVVIENKDLWEKLSEVVYYAESALRESYDVAAYLLSELVGETNVKAVLTGQGADEIFNGYVGYLTDFVRVMKRKEISADEQELNLKLWGDPYFRYERNHADMIVTNKLLYSKELKDDYDSFSALKSSPIDIAKVSGLGTQRRRSYIDFKLRLADHLLGDHGDRMTFAHSIEGRHPFLDIRLVEFAANMPDKYKLKGANEKYILKRVADGIVPDEIIKRKKFPFSTPGMTYILKEYPDIVDKYLNQEIIEKHGVFDYDRVAELIEEYKDENFNIEGQYYLDHLQVVLTVSMLCEQFQMTI